jgi:putative ABC transport system permease protein
MSFFRQFTRRLRRFFRRESTEAEMAEEMRFHLEMRTEGAMEEGLSPEDAGYAAQRKFGNIGMIQERVRDQRGWCWLEALIKDLRYATRTLRNSRGFTATVLLTLALGIGANTTAFTVLNRLMLQSLPFRDPASLVQLWSNTDHRGRMGTAPGDYFDVKAQNTVFVDMATYQRGQRMSYAEAGQAPVWVDTIAMTDNFFSVLGVVPALGRLPTEEESRTMAFVCLISDAFWRQHFNADPNVLGRTIRLNGRPNTVIGVLPPSLDDPVLFETSGAPIFYLDPVNPSRGGRNVSWNWVVARLKPGVSLEQAQADLTVVAQRLAHEYPETNKDREMGVIPLPTNHLHDDEVHLTRMPFVLSGLLLLIACVNIANLQLVRTTRRSHEFAIRLSLGCSRGRLIRMLLLESLLLSALGGALGITVSAWSNVYFAQFWRIDMPLNLRVIAYTSTLSLVTGALSGVVPALLAFRGDVGGALKSGGRGATSDRSRHWLRQSLVVIELALALTLLAGAGFFVSGIYRLTHRDLGWDTTYLITARVSLDNAHYGGAKNRDKVLALADHALETLGALPGIQSVALSDGSPAWGHMMSFYRVEGRAPPEKGQEPKVVCFAVSPGWFEVYGMHLVEGRGFSEADHADAAPVAIVSESMARKLWPGESAIGKRIAQADMFPPAGDKKASLWAEIVGVIRDFKGGAEFTNPAMNNDRILRPWAQDRGGIVFSIRTAGPPGPLKESVRKAIGLLLPDRALDSVATVDEEVASSIAYYTFVRRILVQIAGLGLLLSAVGIYGVVANLAAERTKEIGIRMALGAKSADILWLFIRNGLVLACIGATVGLIGAFAFVATLERILPVLPGTNPIVVAGAVAALVAVAIIACWLPARRTTKISPMLALRSE